MTAYLPRLGLMALLVSAGGCYEFQPDTPAGPSELPPAAYVTVRIEYRQPNTCQNAAGSCAQRVVFFASWMRPGEEFPLEPSPGFLWVGQATNVPVNWPPVGPPHLVRIYDPHLVDTPTAGVTASRLKVGGQVLSVYDDAGTPAEVGRVHVDANAVGHNPY
ncbi:MAG: hypothetical protein LJF15_09500 [Acidobacteria bacterium]|jgi:hypothetical protein|nr:hypothetical protein [Acidobacteriota bacterium]